MRILPFAILIATVQSSPAQPVEPVELGPVTITSVPIPPPPAPVELTAQPGVRVGLQAGKRQAAFAFSDRTQTDAVLYPQDAAKRDTWIFQAFRPGVYKLVCATGTADEIAHVTVTVGDQPEPPTPIPPLPPLPDDPFVAALQLAYTADQSRDKAGQLRQLIALYDEAAKLPHAKQPGNDAAYRFASVSAVANALRAASEALLPGSLSEVRKLTVAELTTAFPHDATLNDPTRDKLADVFRRIAAALRQVR